MPRALRFDQAVHEAIYYARCENYNDEPIQVIFNGIGRTLYLQHLWGEDAGLHTLPPVIDSADVAWWYGRGYIASVIIGVTLYAVVEPIRGTT
jgi:hypothetical protein